MKADDLPILRRHGMPPDQPRSAAFTLIEMLVVIAVIAILAAILLTAISTGKTRAKVSVAKTEITNLKAAILAYEVEYERMPASKEAESSATVTCPDFTFSAVIGGVPIANVGNMGYQANNAELMDILTDVDRGANAGHARNTKRIPFFHAKQAPDNNSSGIGPDGIFRDPWGNPYIITIDLNGDDRCLDGFYYGLMKPALIKDSVAVWSAGPDSKVNPNRTAGPKKEENKDNVVSW